jgi:hypothetical protein
MLDKLDAIKNALYLYRNQETEAGAIPPELLSGDAEVIAALEHYFYARHEVASGNYSTLNMKAMIIGYQLAKKIGVDMRHKEDNPMTKPSSLQKSWALLGAEDGEKDLVTENMKRDSAGMDPLSPPLFRLPPNFTGAYGNKRISDIKY